MIKATVDGAVELYHDDVLRLSTSSTGVSIPQDLDVDGHTNLDNVSVAGVSTFGDITATSYGAINATSGSFSGNVSIGGTLTYEDVTNIDSLGIVTARNGVISPYADIDDFISVGSNIHLGNAGVCTATTFSGSGASLTNLNGSNIASGTVPVARIGTGTKNNTTFYRGDGTFQVVNTDLVSDTSPQLGGSLDVNGNQILVGDGGPGNTDESICIGDSKDLKIYHDGNSVIYDNGVGDLKLFTNGGAIKLQKDTGENMVVANTDGTVELYEDNAIKLRTGVTGEYGSIQLQNGKNGWYGVSCNGQTVFMSDGNDIGLYNDVDNEWLLKGTRNGEVQLRYNDSIKLQTTSSGVSITGNINVSGYCSNHFAPSANNTYDLGFTNYRWRNIYTNDLNLSNEGGKNKVDGTWGNYTIQEGESDLFLINNRSGKKYKFNLTEVS